MAMQLVVEMIGGEVYQKELPAIDAEVLPGIPWEHCAAFFSPAYWAAQAWFEAFRGKTVSHRLGNTLIEEAAACLLGGHGIPAEVGLAAFSRMRDRGFFETERAASAGETEIRAELCEPLRINGRALRYRFPGQKARSLVPLLQGLARRPPRDPREEDPLEFRAELLRYRGIGPKTASWITRNWLGSDNVAILDIHVIRAGVLCRLFPLGTRPEHGYFLLEARFLEFAVALGVRASLLDALMWRQMRQCPHSVRSQLKELAKEESGNPAVEPCRAANSSVRSTFSRTCRGR